MKKEWRDCVICKKGFLPSHSHGQRTCSLKCGRKLRKQTFKNKKREYLDKNFVENSIKNGNSKKLLRLVKDKKYKVTDERTIKDDDSPTGRVYVGVAKHPLQPASGHYGYLGVLLQSDNRQFVQCHICGKWMRNISQKHLEGHETTQKEYRQDFGLYPKKALIPDAVSYKLEEKARKLWSKKDTQKELQKLASYRKKQQKNKTFNRGKEAGQSIERQNKYGTCYKQLEFRLLEYVKEYRMLPSRSTKGEGGKICKTLHRRFGSTNLGFKEYGLPVRHRVGTTCQLVAPNGESISFNYIRTYDRHKVYEWIVRNSKAPL